MIIPNSIEFTAIFFFFHLKYTGGIRTRIDLGDGPVSLGLPCNDNSQCQLSDPYTYCNERNLCDCAHQSEDVTSINLCSAEYSGCAEGTFQVRLRLF